VQILSFAPAGLVWEGQATDFDILKDMSGRC